MISTSSQAESRHADQVAEFVFHPTIEADQEINRPRAYARHSSQEFRQFRPRRFGFEIRAQFAGHGDVVGKGTLFSRRLQEKVERIEDAHFGNQIDPHEELGSRFREHQSRKEVALGVLLPVNVVVFGTNLQRIRQDGCAAVRRRPQPYNLRSERDPAIVTVVRLMGERDVNGHK
jgi:hypothetical protein